MIRRNYRIIDDNLLGFLNDEGIGVPADNIIRAEDISEPDCDCDIEEEYCYGCDIEMSNCRGIYCDFCIYDMFRRNELEEYDDKNKYYFLEYGG